MTDKIHILPINDLIEHIEDSTCTCGPTIKHVEGGTLIVHNALDGREVIEKWEEDCTKILH